MWGITKTSLCGDVVDTLLLQLVVVMWKMWVAWSLLVSCLGMKEGCAHCDNITRNNKQQHCHCLSFGSHVAHSDMAPSILCDVDARSLGDMALPCRHCCCGCGWQMCMAAASGGHGEVGIMDVDGGWERVRIVCSWHPNWALAFSDARFGCRDSVLLNSVHIPSGSFLEPFWHNLNFTQNSTGIINQFGRPLCQIWFLWNSGNCLDSARFWQESVEDNKDL